jgi:hypothetical protein
MAPRTAAATAAACVLAAALLATIHVAQASASGTTAAAPASGGLAAECARNGFIVGQLACTTCQLLHSHGLVDAAAECGQCCSATLDHVSGRRYETAILQLCRTRVANYGGVNEFLEKSAGAYPELDVVDMPGAMPALILGGDEGLDAGEAEADKGGNGGRAAERVVIANWKTEQISAFLNARLKRS